MALCPYVNLVLKSYQLNNSESLWDFWETWYEYIALSDGMQKRSTVPSFTFLWNYVPLLILVETVSTQLL